MTNYWGLGDPPKPRDPPRATPITFTCSRELARRLGGETITVYRRANMDKAPERFLIIKTPTGEKFSWRRMV